MNFTQLLKKISRYKSFIFLMFISAVITSVLLTYVLSEKYRASTSVLIRPQKSIDMVRKKDEILNFSVNYYTPVDTASKTYSEILKSRVIAERIVNKLGLHKGVPEKGPEVVHLWRTFKNKSKAFLSKFWTILKYGRLGEANAFNLAVEKVSRNLSVTPTRDTYMFKIEAEAKSSAMAAQIAASAAEVFVEYLRDMSEFENEKAKQISKEKLIHSMTELENARNAIVEFKKKNKIISIDKETELNLERIAKLTTVKNEIRTKITGLNTRKEKIKRQISAKQKFKKSAYKVVENPILKALYLDLSKNEIKLAGLREKLTEEHQDVKILNAEIIEIKSKIQDLSPTIKTEETISVNPLYQELDNELSIVVTDLDTLKAQEAFLDQKIQTEMEIVGVTPKHIAQLSKLELDENIKRETHILLSKEYEEIGIAILKNTPDIRVINRAVAPAFPVSPIKIYHAGLAAFFSIVCSIGMVLLFESLNVTIRSLQEAEQNIDLPVMMSIPYLKSAALVSSSFANSDKNFAFTNSRIDQRVYVQYSVQVSVHNGTTQYSGQTGDISRSGICFYSNQKFKADERIKIVMDTQNTPFSKIVLNAVILRSQSTIEGYGFYSNAAKIIDIDKPTNDKLNALINSSKTETSFSTSPQLEESIRGLRSDILFLKNNGKSTFLISSSVKSEGKSVIIANLAVSLTKLKRKVLLIDANLREPVVHNLFGLSNETGLAQFLTGESPIVLKKTKTGLSVLTSGQLVNDSSALFDSEKLKDIIKMSSDNFDIVLIDSAPILSAPDTAAISSFVDGSILIVKTGETSIVDVLRAKHILKKNRAEILGIVLNFMADKTGGYYIWR